MKLVRFLRKNVEIKKKVFGITFLKNFYNLKKKIQHFSDEFPKIFEELKKN